MEDRDTLTRELEEIRSELYRLSLGASYFAPDSNGELKNLTFRRTTILYARAREIQRRLEVSEDDGTSGAQRDRGADHNPGPVATSAQVG